jgi:carbamoyl-phosphate synthase large subunit
MTTRKNIAVLAAGRRVELVQAFMEQAALFAPDTFVYGVDLNPALSSACHVAHKSVACPRATSAEYEKFLTTFFETEQIGLVIPTIDTDLQVLADNRLRWAEQGTWVSISDSEMIANCRDKRLSGGLFEAIGVRYPSLYTAETITYPAFMKPVSGSSSKGAMLLRTSADLPVGALSDPTQMVMEYVGGPYKEYSVDAFFDQHSRFIAAVPRLRIETRAGEISKGITAKNGLYHKLAKGLKYWQGMRGCITLQVFYDETSDDIVGLEINPRFGGGFPLSYSAGANYPAMLIQEYFNTEAPQFFEDWQDRLLMLRYDAKVLVHNANI